MNIFITLQKDEIAFLQVSDERCYMMKYARTLPNIIGGNRKQARLVSGGLQPSVKPVHLPSGPLWYRSQRFVGLYSWKKTDVLPGIYTDHVTL